MLRGDYDPAADIRNELEKAEDAIAAEAEEELQWELFVEYESRGCCPVCSIQEGKATRLPGDGLCLQCREFAREPANVIGIQEWHRQLEKIFRQTLARCPSNKVCHPTESAAAAHADTLSQKGYRADVYFHRECASYHVGDPSNKFRRKLRGFK